MEQEIFQLLWLGCYWYYIEQMGSMEKGMGKRALGICLTGAVLACSFFVPLFGVKFRAAAAWVLIAGILTLYDLFFDAEAFVRQGWRILLPGMCIAVGILAAEAEEIFVLHGGIMLVFLLLLGKKRESLRLWNGVLLVAAYGIIGAFLWLLGCTGQVETTALPRSIFLWGGIVLEALLFLAVEGTLFSYKKGFDFRTEQFRSELMEHQYDEIKSVYMDMRGWRHDYHNHMQVMKAQLALGNTEEMGAYLDQLERAAALDPFEKADYLLTYVIQAGSREGDGEVREKADEYATRLAKLDSNSIPIYLAEYYLGTGRTEQGLEQAERYVGYVSADAAVWQKTFDLLEEYEEDTEQYRAGVRRVAELLDAWNAENLGRIELSGQTQAFIGRMCA